MGPYLGILVAAAIEGEVVYVSAAVAASLGKLDALGVLLSGSVGGWAGDQFWFYAARGPLSNWLNRFENVSRRRRAVQNRMHRHATKLILGVRFLPGLRIAIPIACAYSGVTAVRFSGLSFISALAWANAIMFMIVELGLHHSPLWGLDLVGSRDTRRYCCLVFPLAVTSGSPGRPTRLVMSGL